MSRRSDLFGIGLALASLLLCFAETRECSAAKPNIVFIMADDLGLGDVRSYTASSPVDTPNIDRIAAAGMRFTNSHSPSAVCSPTRYGVLTGRYAWRTRLKSGVLGAHAPALIEAGRTTVASMLQQHGYSTAAFGKWHLGMNWVTSDGKAPQANGYNVDYSQPFTGGPTAHGFDAYYADDIINRPPYSYIEDDRTVGIPSVRINGSGGPGLQTPGYEQIDSLPSYTNRAVAFIHDKAGEPEPFFVYMALTAPHAPIVPPDSIPLGGSEYDRFIKTVDWAVGQVLDALESGGGVGETMIVFTSDNGVSKHFSTSDDVSPGFVNGTPLRGQKADVWEAGHRVPFIVRWDGHVQAATTSNEYVELNDFFATVADVVGVRLPPSVAEDSYNLRPVLEGEIITEPIREAGVNHSLNGSFVIRQFDEMGNEWKLIFTDSSGGFTSPSGKPIDPNATITDFSKLQLFNLTADVGEQTNLLADEVTQSEKQRVLAMQTLLQRYMAAGRSTTALLAWDRKQIRPIATED